MPTLLDDAQRDEAVTNAARALFKQAVYETHRADVELNRRNELCAVAGSAIAVATAASAMSVDAPVPESRVSVISRMKRSGR